MWECRSCGGTYQPIGADGVRYFHSCPPLSRHEFEAAVHAGTIVPRPLESIDDAFARRLWPRSNPRDENVTRAPAPGQPAAMKHAGAGIDVVPDVEP